MRAPSRTSGTEQGQDIACLASKIADRANAIMAVHRASFIERYMQADGHIAIRGINAGTAQYGFLVEAVPVPHGDFANQARVKAYSSWEYERIQEAPVFPGQVQIMEGAQCVIPSRIWLQRFNDDLT